MFPAPDFPSHILLAIVLFVNILFQVFLHSFEKSTKIFSKIITEKVGSIMSLTQIREKIDEIDAQLLPLFIERMQCAETVAKTKLETNQPIFNAEREEQILSRVAERAREYGCEAKMLYTTLMALSRARQHKLMLSGKETRREIEVALQHRATLDESSRGKIIACPGVACSHSHEAAQLLFPNREIRFFECFPDVFRAVEQGDADFGFVPVENSSAGSVTQVYDLILKYRFRIVGAVTQSIRHCLAAAPGGSMDTLRTIYSHPQALAQCSGLIARHHWDTAEATNTACAAKLAGEKHDPSLGVICSTSAAKQYGLAVLQDNVQDNDRNRTRFIAIHREMLLPQDANKISLCFSLPHTTGSLYTVLARFAMNGLNLTKIESRPAAHTSGEDSFEYDFYLDFTGNVENPNTRDLLCELSCEMQNFSFLGNYVE